MDEAAIRQIWGTGDYATIGDMFASVGQELVNDVGVNGLDVLDVATGTGNTAIAAARAGGRVTGLDITPQLLEIARSRAAAEGLDIRWVEADMRHLDVPDSSFDRVLSTFGAMVAPDPVEMAAELVRVCRPGGLVASTAWRPEAGFTKLGAVFAGFLPAPPAPPHDPTEWARPERVTAFLAGLPVELNMYEGSVTVNWSSIDDAIAMLTASCGPLIGVVSALQAKGSWPQARAALSEMLAGENKAADGSLSIEMPYLVTVARVN
jgi:SAM-dependent methyltransferase